MRASPPANFIDRLKSGRKPVSRLGQDPSRVVIAQFNSMFERKKNQMNNRLISCPSWLSKPPRQLLLAAVLCLLVLGLSAFSFAPSTRAASASSAHAATVQVSGSASRLSVPQKRLSINVANSWYRWKVEHGSCSIVGCWAWKLTIQGDGVYNPSIRQIWQWHVFCTWGGLAKLTSCTYSGNGSQEITLIVQGKTVGVSHGALIEVNYRGQVVRESNW